MLTESGDKKTPRTIGAFSWLIGNQRAFLLASSLFPLDYSLNRHTLVFLGL
jgi:hypothetical protein